MFWLALGKLENWISAFNFGNTWGLKLSQKTLWDQLKTGDNILFYVTSPISGVVGVGELTTKFRQDRPLWPEEINKGEVIWPLRFQFNISGLLTRDDWEKKRVRINDLNMQLRIGFQNLSNSNGMEVMKRLDRSQRDTSSSETELQDQSIKRSSFNEHNRIRDLLIEMGKMQTYFAEKEYPMDGYRLDAVWRKIYSGVPTYVFEVQVGGSVEQAIGKLKHAHDKWNSNIFIVLDNKDENKAKNLLSGTFHEIRDQVRVIKLEEIDKLYEMKRTFKEKEKVLGID